MNAERRRILRKTTQKGFSLLELLLVIGILAVLASIGFGFYQGFVRGSEVDLAAKEIVFNLKKAQAKSMAGEDGKKWGAHFVNGASDYYEIFSTPTDYNDGAKTIESTVYLSGGVSFTEPAVSSDIIFDKIRGTLSSQSSVVVSSPAGGSKTITVTTMGNIY
ncbi:prepilin-type N-terminal cleavage/methylation domain-containing protein [Candidatus Falkowbacteria bacterium]|nr:prepilin-type N-terminal cleavage/methylation domain-containing protein [Candidatus Falkowbacteria bacterium]